MQDLLHNDIFYTDFLFQYSPLAPVYADNLVAAMATATTVSDDTTQQNSPDQAAEERVLGESLELMEDMPPLTGVYMCVCKG